MSELLFDQHACVAVFLDEKLQASTPPILPSPHHHHPTPALQHATRTRSCRRVGLSLSAPDLCAGLTLIIAVFLIVFAFQTKYDFTGIGPYLMVALLCLVLFAFVMIIFTDSRVSATLRLLSD